MKRITTTQAAEILNVSVESVRVYAKSKFITAITVNNTFGRGQRMYFDEAEVNAFAKGGAVGAQAYRDGIGNIRPLRKHPKRRTGTGTK